MKSGKSIVIHAAVNRETLCGFGDGLDPNDWKTKNYWCKPTSKKYKGRINCKSCLKKMKSL